MSLCFQGGGQWPSRDLTCGCFLQEAGCGLLAGLSSVLHVLGEHLLFTQRRAGLLGIPKKRMPSLALMAPVAFLGWFRAGFVGHVVLNTCSFCLLVSPCCPMDWGEEVS